MHCCAAVYGFNHSSDGLTLLLPLRHALMLGTWAVQQEYWRMKQDLILTERALLTKLGFHVAVEHPHKFILSYLRVLGSENDGYVLCTSVLFHELHNLTKCLCFMQRISTEGVELFERQLAHNRLCPVSY